MRIRWKLLFILLTFAIIPLALLSIYQRQSLCRMGSELGTHTRQQLLEKAEAQMLHLARNAGIIVQNESNTVQVILLAQAREVERCLADPPPAPSTVYWDHDFDSGRAPTEASDTFGHHFRFTEDGMCEPLPISMQYQVFKVAPGTNLQDVSDDIRRLAPLAKTYRELRQAYVGLMRWQYTALANGLHCSYPGHGGYPEDFDPRQRDWYKNTLRNGALTWSPPSVDASTKEVVLTTSMPVRRPDGTIAGVTGLDVSVTDLVQYIDVPTAWASSAETKVIATPRGLDRQGIELSNNGRPGILIIAQRSYAEDSHSWKTPIKLEVLYSEDNTEMQRLIDDLAQNKAGVRTMPYRGNQSVWAYGPLSPDGGSAMLIIVPHDEIIAQAVQAEQHILERTRAQLQTAGAAVFFVALVIVIVAFVGSRNVTRPVAELVATAKRISTGDTRARAKVNTHDEIGELGRAFNDMIPQLADRLRLRRSLSLAMEVQQHLLPEQAPRTKGFDVSGRSIYCDETGGDYYDFIDLSELGPHRLGVAVGDVTGHGIAAALLMATARAMLRSRVAQPESLADLICDMNRQLTADTVGGRFMTLVYMILDSRELSVRWVCAGHDPAITYDPSTDTFGELDDGGVPLGIDEDWQYEEYSAPLTGHGQIIVIGTDGIWEARNPAGKMFGKDALRQIIRKNHRKSADDISRAVTDSLATFQENYPQQDDITLVVIKINPRKS